MDEKAMMMVLQTKMKYVNKAGGLSQMIKSYGLADTVRRIIHEPEPPPSTCAQLLELLRDATEPSVVYQTLLESLRSVVNDPDAVEKITQVLHTLYMNSTKNKNNTCHV